MRLLLVLGLFPSSSCRPSTPATSSVFLANARKEAGSMQSTDISLVGGGLAAFTFVTK